MVYTPGGIGDLPPGQQKAIVVIYLIGGILFVLLVLVLLAAHLP